MKDGRTMSVERAIMHLERALNVSLMVGSDLVLIDVEAIERILAELKKGEEE